MASITTTRQATSPASGRTSRPARGPGRRVMLRARLPVFSLTSRSSQRMSGWLPASTSLAIAMVVGRVEAGQVDRRPGGVGEHPRRRRAGEARLADALRPGEQPGMMQRAALPGGGELLDRAVLTDDHGSRSAIASSRRCGDLVRGRPMRRPAAPARAPPRRSAGRRFDLVVIFGRAAADPVAAVAVARPRPLRRPRRAIEHQGSVGQKSPHAESVDRRAPRSMPSPPAPPW